MSYRYSEDAWRLYSAKYYTSCICSQTWKTAQESALTLLKSERDELAEEKTDLEGKFVVLQSQSHELQVRCTVPVRVCGLLSYVQCRSNLINYDWQTQLTAQESTLISVTSERDELAEEKTDLEGKLMVLQSQSHELQVRCTYDSRDCQHRRSHIWFIHRPRWQSNSLPSPL